jgi:hypothetical protein
MKGVLIVHGSFSIFYHLFKHRTPVDRVKWFRDRVDRDRFREEAQILDAEFKWTIISFSRMSEVWTELAIKAASPGSAAYAHRKATMYLVMCTARLQAVGQAKPGPIRPSQAGPKSRPDHGFGPAQDPGKPKPSAQATAFELNFWTMRERLVSNFPKLFRTILGLVTISGTFTKSGHHCCHES